MSSIEEEIQQKKFSSEHQKAVINILFTAAWLRNMHSAKFKEYDISLEQYNVMRILRGSYPKPMMLCDITSRMIEKNSNATRLVEKLRLKGLVKRETCAENRRQVDIIITEKGLSVLTKLDNETGDWNEMLQHVSVNEAKELNRILDKLRK